MSESTLKALFGVPADSFVTKRALLKATPLDLSDLLPG